MAPILPEPFTRLLGQKDRIEGEIARVEARLRKRDGRKGRTEDEQIDGEMISSLKSLLVALRNEHRVLVATLEHAIRIFDERRAMATTDAAMPIAPCSLSAPSPLPFNVQTALTQGAVLPTLPELDSLVMRVKDAVRPQREAEGGEGEGEGEESLLPTDLFRMTTWTHDQDENIPPPQSSSNDSMTMDNVSFATFQYLAKYNLLDRHTPHPRGKTIPKSAAHEQYSAILDSEAIKRLPKLF